MNKTPFASWAKLELMGHLSLMGYVEEVEIFGITMVCVLPIDDEGKEGSKRYFGPSSIYSLSPLPEEEIRALISRRQESAARRLLLLAPRPPTVAEEPIHVPDEVDEDDGSEDDEGLADRPPNWF